MDESAERTKVEWREWGEDAFEEAQEADKPVLLSLSATWCSWCHEMDEETYSVPTLAANVNDSFVPVRVDVDRNPRVRERYNVGGFPSTVFCTPSGDHLTGATYLGPDAMRQVLGRVRDLWNQKGEEAAQVPRSLRDQNPPGGEVTADIERNVAGQLTEKYDATHGGWGDDAKFPLPRTVEFGLKRERETALGTLAAVREHLFDDYDGGFFRYAGQRDWSDVHHEKVLDANAALLRAYANAYLYTGDDDHREVAGKTVEYLTTTLWRDETGAFGGSQRPDDDYYAGSPSDREGADSPAVDPTAFADWNALAADALLTYHAYTDDERARRYAERTLAFLDGMVEDGAVVHYRAGDERDGTGERGLLADQAHVAAAFATAAQVLGTDGTYLDTARAVADHAVETLQNDELGAFVDGPVEGPGLLDWPLRPVDGNAAMASALVDLWALTGEERYRSVARDAVGAFAGAADRLDVQVAGYATAAARLVDAPLRIDVAAPAGSDLHRAALRVADHEKVVVPSAHEAGVDEEYEAGHAYVVAGGDVSGPVATPEELSERVADLF
ncbi:DUF255 domain-containing protein [Halomicrococcus sp. NG-SE-24]|uniref:DUF255 domain-containing protein n=1 Tax=Halomicrococcus sp. NG-SE-24 TaxID=3436928 RepID=UPI003D9960AE